MSMFRRRLLMQQALRVPAFPEIPGLIARYSARGLTNEEMSKTNVWKDLTGNGHDLVMHNFAWSKMSGCNGYAEDYSTWRIAEERCEATTTESTINITKISGGGVFAIIETSTNRVIPHKIKITGIESVGITITLDFNKSVTGVEYLLVTDKDGVYDIPEAEYESNVVFGIKSNKNIESCSITIEQLPLYPNALVSDGVDDYGICENFPILTKEEGYTVVAVRKWLEGGNLHKVLATQGNSKTGGVSFRFEYFGSISELSPHKTNSFGQFTKVDYGFHKDVFSYQTSTSYNGTTIGVGNNVSTNGLYLFTDEEHDNDFGSIALYDLLIYSRDLTEEEIGKIKTYFAKIHPDLSIN